MCPGYALRDENGWRFAKNPNPTPTADPLVDRWEDWQRGAGLADSTITMRLMVVNKFAEETGVSCVSACPDDIVDWMAGHTEWAPKTRRNYYDHLKAWFVWLNRWDYRIDNPIVKVPLPKLPTREPRPVSDNDLVRLLESPRMHKRTRMMVMLHAYTGLRVHEIAKVRGEHFDLNQGLNGVLRVVDGKNDVTKSVPLHPRLARAVESMPATGYWFTGKGARSKKPVAPTTVSNTLARLMRRAGVRGTPHSMRHWFATALLESGADLRTVQECMRHKSITATAIYTLVPDKRRHEAVARLDPYGRRGLLDGA